ncbi:MAG TPA: pseudouridine synthase [Aggregatilineaceae bacterium]|jgi:pseudouridine synthase|nr:rRNA pseudouridine synthase [Anaerolineae bacterium]HMM26899.1 pseudouridine synthase [Aggregatilineaceae bacterium]
MPEERLQKLISQAQIASRRAAEEMIRAGRVTVDGRVAQLGDKADPAVQDVRVDGRRLAAAPDYVYILLYKPRGVVSSNKREAHEKRPLVRSLIPHEGHLFTVGRLDADSEGLILLTNDGALADRLMHPKYGHAKTYEVLVEGQPSRATLDKWRQGVPLGDEVSAPAKVRVLEVKPNETWIQVIMREGRKRQIRRIASQLGHPVKRLIRTQIEMLTIGRLQPGEWRKLSPREVRKLKGE